MAGAWWRGEVCLRSPLSPAECRARIDTIADVESFTLFSWSGYVGTKPILCRDLDGDLRLQRRIFHKDDFRRFLYCRLNPDNGGTILAGRFRMRPFPRAFLCLWCGGVGFLGVLNAFTHLTTPEKWLPQFLFALVMIGLGLVIWVGWPFSRRGEKKLLALLESTLEATECDNPPET
ncbi:MAG TPA: hypothetical protein VMF30_16020 [Pirellulales bacterium]|nr:hypothetical protein [Pirellulales bacterium]